MSMFAVVAIGGKQYKVSPKDVVSVEKLDQKVGDTVTFESVLLFENDGKITVGAPNVKNVHVKAKVLSQEKGEKIAVRRFKSKVRHRKHTGFRPQITKLEILTIG
jgi:large subunit ribosomal protein L21